MSQGYVVSAVSEIGSELPGLVAAILGLPLLAFTLAGPPFGARWLALHGLRGLRAVLNRPGG